MKKLFVLLAIIGAVAAIANALRRDDLKNDIDRATSSMGGSTPTPAPAPVPSADGAEAPAAEDAATGTSDAND
ncbi:MAG: hypothetical protein AAFY28_03145 [Actinomycetota bacterium]